MNLNQVTVPSSNIPASIEFYQKIGLKLIVHTHDRYARFECPDGDSTLSIHYVEEPPSGEGIYIYFEVADVEAKVHEFRTLGIWMETEAVEQSWLWTEARLKDPDRNQIIIFHAGANRKNPPWRREDDAGN